MNFSTSIIKPLTYQTILTLVSEYDIFKYYLGSDFRIGTAILSPLRKERNPSFSVFYAHKSPYKLKWKDFGTNDSGSCFDLVMRLYSISFVDALAMVDRDMNLGIWDCKPTTAIKAPRTLLDDVGQRYPTKIEVRIRKWNNTSDRDFWSKYGITCKILKFYNVYPLEYFRVNSWENNCLNPTYGYYNGNGKWKIYAPFSEIKWLSNITSEDIQGYHQLPNKGDFVIITKSLKDVMTFYSLGISALAPQTESSMLKKSMILELKERFNRIYVNYDYDRIGMLIGNRYRKIYGLKSYYFTNGYYKSYDYGAKDVSDHVKIHGRERTKEIIDNIVKNENKCE